jgi:hypothetical protein
MAESFMVLYPLSKPKVLLRSCYSGGLRLNGESSPNAGLLQGFADKDNCTFGQDARAQSQPNEHSGVRSMLAAIFVAVLFVPLFFRLVTRTGKQPDTVAPASARTPAGE